MYNQLEDKQKVEVTDPLSHFFPYIANLSGPVRPTFGDERLVERDLLMFGTPSKEMVGNHLFGLLNMYVYFSIVDL